MSIARCARVSQALVDVVSLVAAASVAAVEKISVVAFFKDKAMVVLDGKQRLLPKGQRSPEGVTLIRADAKGATLEIAGKRNLYPLGRQISTQFKSARCAPVSIWPTAEGMYNVSGTINGFLHCRYRGDPHRNEARRLGINFRLDGRKSCAQTAYGVVNTYNVRLNKVRVGTIALKDVQASVTDGYYPKQVSLGNSFLNRLRLDINRKGRALELRSRNY